MERQKEKTCGSFKSQRNVLAQGENKFPKSNHEDMEDGVFLSEFNSALMKKTKRWKKIQKASQNDIRKPRKTNEKEKQEETYQCI